MNSGTGGEYVFTLLRPGKYRLTVSQAGFESYEQSGIVLEINQRAYLAVNLEVEHLEPVTDRRAEAL